MEKSPVRYSASRCSITRRICEHASRSRAFLLALMCALVLAAASLVLVGCSGNKTEDTNQEPQQQTQQEGEIQEPVLRAEDGTIDIMADGKKIGSVTLDEIKQYRAVKRRVVIDSTAGFETCDFGGTQLSNVLSKIPATYTSAIIRGSDGYESRVTQKEVAAENNVFIMYENKGEPLKRLDGSDGAMRCVILGDTYGQRFTNYVVEIDLISGGEATP